MRSRKNGFTLVELLVVIGIIALLISILLPSLSKARKQAVAVQCQSNMRQIGQAMLMYSTTYKGAIVPCVVWNGGNNDGWAFLLVANKFLPDPRLKWVPGAPAGGDNVLVCPAIRDLMVANNPPSGSGPGTTIVAGTDGFDQRGSTVILPGTGTPGFAIPLPEPLTNGALGACVIDFGYGINGCVNASGAVAADWYNVPSTAISYNGGSYPATKRTTNFRRSADTVILFDGTEWNIMNGSPASTPTGYPSAPLWRISGSRHGKWNPGAPYASGTTNLLFLDWHVEPANRSSLPQWNGTAGAGSATGAQLTGPRTDMPRTGNDVARYIWNTSQQY